MRKVSNPMTETIENTANLPYKNPELPTEERIADLLGRMTLEEKVGQMMQLDARSGDLDDLIVNKHVGSILHTSPSDLPKAVETVNTKTRLGIPLVIGDDCIHGYSFWPGATIFPEQLGMATTWDSEKSAGRGPCHRRGSVDYRRALDVLSGAVHRARHPLGSRGRNLWRGPVPDRRNGIVHRQRLSGWCQGGRAACQRRDSRMRQAFRGLFRNPGRP